MGESEQPIGGDGEGGIDLDGDETAVFCAVDATRCTGMPTPTPEKPSVHGGDRDADHDAAHGVGAAGGADDAAGARAALAAIRDAIALLRDLPLWMLGQEALLELTGQVESTLRSGFGVQIRLAGELHERGVAGILDVRSAAHLLHERLNITMADARGRVAAATAALPGETPTGAITQPAAPELIDAIDQGQVSAGHTRVITGCLAGIPDPVDEPARALCRRTLLDQARHRDEHGLRQVAEQIRLILDPDGHLSGKDPADRAELSIGQQRRDGLTPIRGLLDQLTAEELRVAVEALAAPTPVDANTPDPRPAPLRRAQALGEILHRYLAAGAGPRDGGVRPQVVITIGIDDLLGRPDATGCPHNDTGCPHNDTGDTGARRRDVADLFAGLTADAAGSPGGAGTSGGSDGPGSAGTARGGGFAWLDYTGVADPAIARLLACDATLIRQVIGPDSVVLDQGRATRLFTPEQRRALTTRDKGCGFPGCDMPPAWCECHHVIWWSLGGTTDTSRGVLLCRRHHVLIHQGRWSIELDPDGGRPWFIPPAYVDTDRKPAATTTSTYPPCSAPSDGSENHASATRIARCAGGRSAPTPAGSRPRLQPDNRPTPTTGQPAHARSRPTGPRPQAVSRSVRRASR